jgi:hypothetical protein
VAATQQYTIHSNCQQLPLPIAFYSSQADKYSTERANHSAQRINLLSRLILHNLRLQMHVQQPQPGWLTTALLLIQHGMTLSGTP